MQQSYFVRDSGEYGEFFVNEREPVTSASGYTSYSATWVCYSSFGVFGHHWSSMGEPFAEFIRDVDSHYLLGKISSEVLDERKMVAGVRKAIIERRRQKAISADVAREALDTLTSLSEEHSGDVLAHEIYMSTEISKTGVDLCEVPTREYPRQAVEFVRRLWPKFVAAVNTPAEITA